MKEYLFTTSLETRDYECDLQGVVNNANYQHYLEYTRHKWLQSRGQSFQQWHEKGIDAMVSEINIKYKSPLHGQEEFLSCLNLHREGARYVYIQDFRRETGELCMRARVDVVVGVQGKLTRGDLFADWLKDKINLQEVRPTRTSTRINDPLDEVIYDYEMKVRDYECDVYGSATNAYVQRYLEVTRLEFMEEMGETFRKWHENGVDMMVTKVDLKFIKPMMSSEKFHSLMNIRQDGPRVIFEQEIRRKQDMRLCVRASVEIVSIVNGQLDTEGKSFDYFMNVQVPAWKKEKHF